MNTILLYGVDKYDVEEVGSKKTHEHAKCSGNGVYQLRAMGQGSRWSATGWDQGLNEQMGSKA